MGGPSDSTLSVAWLASTSNVYARHSVGIRKLGIAAWKWDNAIGNSTHTKKGLASGQEWEVVVRDETSGSLSDVLRMRTATEGAIHTTAYRIAEFVFEPDFLANHDGADKHAMPVYIQNGGAKNESLVVSTHCD